MRVGANMKDEHRGSSFQGDNRSSGARPRGFPSRPWWCWPVIRHVRYYYLRWRVNQHYGRWRSVGYLPVHADKDYEVLDAIWRGEV